MHLRQKGAAYAVLSVSLVSQIIKGIYSENLLLLTE